MSDNIIKITDVQVVNNDVILNFSTNGIEISTMVQDTENIPYQEIITKGYSDVRPHINMECLRLGIVPPNQVETIEDTYTHIELQPINDMQCHEGQAEIIYPLKCIVHTKFGKKRDVSNETTFLLTDEMTKYGFSMKGYELHILPNQSGEFTIVANYSELGDKKSFVLTYLTKAQYEEQEAEKARKIEEERLKRLEELKLTKIAEIQKSCNADILNGFTCHVKDEDRIFGFEFDDQINLISQLTIFTANPMLESVIWKCKGLEGLVDEYTKVEFLTICQAAEIAKRDKINRFWVLKQQALSATTEDEVNGIAW